MDRARIVEYYLSKIDDKHFTILEARQEMETQGIAEDEIRVIIRLIDNALHRKLAEKSRAGSVNLAVWVGGVITCIGLVLTVGSYTGLIDMGSYYLVAYGPILGGLAIMFGGFNKTRDRNRV